MRVLIFLGGVTLATACATAPQASIEDRTLPFGCNDIVVVGDVRNGGYLPVEDGDILGYGWITATVNVRKVVRGVAVPSILPVKYLSHSYMRQGLDFMLVLKRSATGYEITTGQRMSVRPLLASRCE